MKLQPAPPDVIEGFLKELLGARKALRLYPAANPLAVEWVQRLHRAVEGLLRDRPPLRLQVTQGGFEWDGGQLPTRDRALEAFRFELATRKITEISIAAGVETGELRGLLEFLNAGPRPAEAGAEASAPDFQAKGHIALGGSLSRYHQAEAVSPAAAGADLLEAAVVEILAELESAFREITYDRVRLSAWLGELARADDPGRIVALGIQMLIPLFEVEPDRELRYRTLTESMMALNEPLRTEALAVWLMPAVRSDANIVKLLGRFSGDDFAELAGLIPVEVLQQLRADIEASSMEEWIKIRISESLEDAITEKEVAATPLEPIIAEDDPLLAPVRQAARAACAPERVLEHSVTVLYHLVGETEAESYPVLLAEVLEEAGNDALGQGQLPIALGIVRWFAEPERLRPEWHAEHHRRYQLLRRRLAGRAHITRLVDLLRREDRIDHVHDAAAYLKALAKEAVEEFIDILGDEPDGPVRVRLVAVLETMGPDAEAAIRARLTDKRWTVVRSMVTLLGQVGSVASLDAVVKIMAHPHPMVRREVARVMGVLGGRRAIRPLLECLADGEIEVRRAALKAIQALVEAGSVAPIRDFLASPTRTVADVLVKRELIASLAATGRPEAREILDAIARRRLWWWRGNDRKVRAIARDALTSASSSRSAPAATPAAQDTPAPDAAKK
jgi:HEAT repeats